MSIIKIIWPTPFNFTNYTFLCQCYACSPPTQCELSFLLRRQQYLVVWPGIEHATFWLTSWCFCCLSMVANVYMRSHKRTHTYAHAHAHTNTHTQHTHKTHIHTQHIYMYTWSSNQYIDVEYTPCYHSIRWWSEALTLLCAWLHWIPWQ